MLIEFRRNLCDRLPLVSVPLPGLSVLIADGKKKAGRKTSFSPVAGIKCVDRNASHIGLIASSRFSPVAGIKCVDRCSRTLRTTCLLGFQSRCRD